MSSIYRLCWRYFGKTFEGTLYLSKEKTLTLTSQVITEQIAVMAATTHQYVAVVLAIQDMFSSIGGAVGQTVSTAVWTGTFRNNLLRFLPPSEIANVDLIYQDIDQQLLHPVGSPERLGVQRAYGESQKWQLTATVGILSLMIPCVLAWRNYQLREHKQVKGTVVCRGESIFSFVSPE